MLPLLLLLQAASGTPAAPAKACPASFVYATPFTAWPTAKASDAPIIGSAVDIIPAPVAEAKFVTAPDRAAKPGTGAIVAGFEVKTAGVYHVAVGGAAARPRGIWIDVIANGQALRSVAHQEGPACSNIAKVVDFDLPAGNYTLQLAGIADPAKAVRVLILPR
jgi:hypothetical protein